MNLAEKILDKQLPVLTECYAFGYKEAQDAMREIAWEAWKMGALSHSDPNERIEITKHAFNEWYDKQIE